MLISIIKYIYAYIELRVYITKKQIKRDQLYRKIIKTRYVFFTTKILY